MTLRILVVGGGIAGPVSAYWLAKAGFTVTVIERSTDRTRTGQGIDIQGPALEVMRKMGLEAEIRSKTTGETGFAICGDDGEAIAGWGREGSGGTILTQEIEIMRGELANILTNAAEKVGGVSFRYGCTVTEIRQSEKGVTVVMSDSEKAEDFDVVVGADGLRSKVRKLALDTGEPGSEFYRPQDLYVAFFSMPSEKSDYPNSRLQNSRGGRIILVRPIDAQRSSCYMCHTASSAKLEGAVGKPIEVQKAAVAEAFAGIKGLAGRSLQGLKDATDFYFECIVQVKLDKWFNDRCVLVGDAAYAPSPLTGQGTGLAILGSYVLAGELAANPDNPSAAFQAYEERLRGYVKKSQYIPLGGVLPRLLNPMTDWGIWLLRTFFRLVAWSGVWKLFDLTASDKYQLPDYGKFHVVSE